jgi:hypothetical protein
MATEPQILSSLSPVYAHLLFYRILPRPSTTVEDSLQIISFLTNKANFGKAQMNVNIYYIKGYQNFIPLAGYKNKPNSNPIKPNSQKAQMNVNLTLTKDYRKKDDLLVRINKPNFVKGPK